MAETNAKLMPEESNRVKRIGLIILTILIIGPLVFFGACFPTGLILINVAQENGVWLGVIIGLALAIFVCYKIIKNIVSS